MRVRIPRDQPTLAAALAAGADRIVIQGEVDLPAGPAGAILDRPVHISGGTLRAHGGWAVIIGESVVLSGVAIENPTGHGVRIVAGAPVLEDVEVRVKSVAVVCEGQSRPILRRILIDGAENGLVLREDTAPDGDELAVKASGSALVSTDRAGGHLARIALASGDQFACVEARGESTTTLAGLTVLSAGCGALHLYASSRLQVDGGHIRASGVSDARFPAVEVREEAAPSLSDLRIDQSAGRAFFLHGTCQVALRRVAIQQTGKNAVEAQGSVVLDVADLTVTAAAGAGVLLRGSVSGRLQDVTTDDTKNVGVALGGAVRVEVDGLVVRQAEGAGLQVAGQARCVVRRMRAELLGCPGIRVHEEASVTLDTPVLRANRGDGIRVEDQATAVVRRGSVTGNEGCGVVANGAARVRLSALDVTQNTGWNLVASDTAEVRWGGGPQPDRISVQNSARVIDSTDQPDGVGDIGHAD